MFEKPLQIYIQYRKVNSVLKVDDTFLVVLYVNLGDQQALAADMHYQWMTAPLKRISNQHRILDQKQNLRFTLFDIFYLIQTPDK